MKTASISCDLSRGSPLGRWKGLGPYYAMFPVDFAFQVVNDFSVPGEAILDPFAGRASSVFAAVASQRFGCGIEINPVGWLYGYVKLHPAPKKRVLERIETIGSKATDIPQQQLEALPEFFLACYHPDVLRFLLAARNSLRWKKNRVDATIMAIILVHLHGKTRSSLSNQMRQGKAMAPEYSIRWWRSHNMTPPHIDPVEFLKSKVEWRYKKGVPELHEGEIILGDSTREIRRIEDRIAQGLIPRFDLLFTSPPYFAISNYFKDQWLRLWMLGGPDRPASNGNKAYTRFESKIAYRRLLETVFEECAEIMSESARVYVRTDAREFTFQTTLEVLTNCFPQKRVHIEQQPFVKSTQTALFGDKSPKPGEVDIILTPH